MSFGKDNPYKYTVSSLVDEEARNKILEYANHETNGNMSIAGRKLFEIALEYLERTNGLEPSPLARARALQKKEEEREERCAWICEAYSRLLYSPNKSIEDALIQAAKEEQMEWPPKTLDLAETLPKYKSILNHLKVNNNQSTVRELQRLLHIDKAELVDRLAFLVDSKKVEVDDMYYGYTCVVYLHQGSNGHQNSNGTGSEDEYFT